MCKKEQISCLPKYRYFMHICLIVVEINITKKIYCKANLTLLYPLKQLNDEDIIKKIYRAVMKENGVKSFLVNFSNAEFK